MTDPEKYDPGLATYKTAAQELAVLSGQRLADYDKRAVSFFKGHPDLHNGIRNVSRFDYWVEPFDSVRKPAPHDLAARGFRQGVMLGFLLGEPVYKDAVHEFGRAFSAVQTSLYIHHHKNDALETRRRRSAYIAELGWHGLNLFPDIEGEVDTIVNNIHPSACSQPSVKAGCGVVLGLAHHAQNLHPIAWTANAIAEGLIDVDAAAQALLDTSS